MPPDILQQSLESLASTNDVTRAIAVFCANVLVFLVALLLLAAVVWGRDRLTLAIVVRLLLLTVVAYALSRIGKVLISDPRPYLVTHTQPLTTVSADNGFPSDHVLLAAALSAAMSWIERRLVVLCAILTLLVALARMAVGAHHTLDVVGSIVIVLLAYLIVRWLPLPANWNQSLLPWRGQPTTQ
ncbi:MAG TPA: phosphatase PAP2 family protein [Ktedonobacterales bacterium]